MRRAPNYIVIILLLVFGSSCADERQTKESAYLANAKIVLDSLNSLDRQDLIKINTQGCIGNCLPWETFTKWSRFHKTLNRLGYHTTWDATLLQYSLIPFDQKK